MKILTKWQTGLDWNTCYLENHDQPRSVTRFTEGGEFRKVGSKVLISLNFSLRGTPYFYQGQEIGMTNGAFNNLDEIVDIESHNVDKMAKSLGIFQPFRWNLINKTSRDNARTPMQWSADAGAGFTSGKPWLKIHPNYTEVNVESDLASDDGIIDYFKRFNAYRKSSDVLKNGTFKELFAGRTVYAFEREYNGEKLIAVCNFSTKSAKMPSLVSGETIISNYEGTSKKLRPYEFRLISPKKEDK
jgi:oligo-1,6-glucosidase